MKKVRQILGMLVVMLMVSLTSFGQLTTDSIVSNYADTISVGDVLYEHYLIDTNAAMYDRELLSRVLCVSNDTVNQQISIVIEALTSTISGRITYYNGSSWVFIDHSEYSSQVPGYTNRAYTDTFDFNAIDTIYQFATHDVIFQNNIMFFDININLTYTEDTTSSSVFSASFNKETTTTIYPNPCTSTLTIDTDDYSTPQVSIYNLTGSLVKSENSNKIDVSELNQGMYLVSVNGGEMRKIIKQ